MIASPNLSLTIAPPGGTFTDYTKYMAWSGVQNNMTITQNFGRQGDTALIPLVDEYTTSPHFYIPVLSTIRLIDNIANLVIFSGIVTDPSIYVDSPNRTEWYLNCTDFTYYADNAIVHGTYNGYTADEIVVMMTEQADCGISAATIANGGYVAPAPQLASFVQNYDTLSNVWRTLAQLAGQSTPYGWYVDDNRELHFYDASTAIDSGVTFTTSPTTSGGGSTTQGHYLFDNFTYEWDGTSIRNRILVQGANQTVAYGTTKKPPTDTWVSNGAQTSWPLRYIVTGTPQLTVGGKTQTVTVAEAGQTGSGAWVVGQNSIGAYFLTAATPPGAGTLIKIWYDYQVPVVARANDTQSQLEYAGPNGGIYEEYIYDSTLTTVPMALNRAMRERQEYAFAVERINFTSDESFMGWVRAGQTCKIINRFIPDSENNYAQGINSTFIVTGNSIQFVDNGGYRQMSITAVRL